MTTRWKTPARIAAGLLIGALLAVLASFVAMRVWISRVQAVVEALETHSAGTDRVADLSLSPSQVVLEPGGGFALVFEPPLLAWHTRVLRGLSGPDANTVVVEYRGGKIHTIWWGLD